MPVDRGEQGPGPAVDGAETSHRLRAGDPGESLKLTSGWVTAQPERAQWRFKHLRFGHEEKCSSREGGAQGGRAVSGLREGPQLCAPPPVRVTRARGRRARTAACSVASPRERRPRAWRRPWERRP